MNAPLSAEALKSALQPIREAKFEPPEDVDPFVLAQSMLAHLGTPDSELRDRLIYSTFVYWIEPDYKALFQPKQLHEILETLLDAEHLRYRLGETDTDSVFTRSFSALTIAPIIVYHRERQFLTADELQNIKEELIGYLRAEQDFRGYVDGKGWAHAVAHTADALNELSLCAEMGKQELREILSVVQDAITNGKTAYTHLEEERLMEVVDSIYSRGSLTDADWESWRVLFAELIAQDFPQGYYASVNLQHFLHSLYMRADQNRWDTTFNTALTELIRILFGD